MEYPLIAWKLLWGYKLVYAEKNWDYKSEIVKLGFVQRRGKGSHQNWKHPQLRLIITIAFKDGEDVPLYLEKLLQKALQELDKD